MKLPTGKTVVITGATSGIGKALRALYEQAGNVVINISRHAVEGANDYAADIADKEKIEAVADDIGRRFGNVDILINNAGYGQSGPLELIPDTEIRRITDVNFLGAVWLTRALIKYMAPGSVIGYVCSVGSIIPMPYRTMYAATKAALGALAFGMRMELKPLGIRVSALYVAAVRTDFSAHREKIQVSDGKYYKALSGTDRFIDDKGGKNATGKLSSEAAARKMARALARKRPKAEQLIATPAYFLAYPLAKFSPGLAISIIEKVFGAC